MNKLRIYRRLLLPLVSLALVTAGLQSAPAARLVEDTFPVLKTRTGTYTNVTVTTRAETYIFILHAGGMTSIKVTDLPVDVKLQLGYAVPESERPPRTNNVVTAAARELNDLNKNLKPIQDRLGSRLPPVKITSEVFYTGLGILLVFYLFFCYCCSQICLKATGSSSLLVWIPVLQAIPLFQAAGMSGWWLVACFVPGLNIVAQVLWCINIAKTRGKTIWVAILLILPVTNIFAFLYLAFSSAAVDDAPPRKFQAEALQTA